VWGAAGLTEYKGYVIIQKELNKQMNVQKTVPLDTTIKTDMMRSGEVSSLADQLEFPDPETPETICIQDDIRVRTRELLKRSLKLGDITQEEADILDLKFNGKLTNDKIAAIVFADDIARGKIKLISAESRVYTTINEVPKRLSRKKDWMAFRKANGF